MRYNLLLNYNNKLRVILQSNSKKNLIEEIKNREGIIRIFNIKNPYKIVFNK
tara:strand:- start:1315 stop:1470 length:156 start_codon:yes stop_codon:yes gene_type:complete